MRGSATTLRTPVASTLPRVELAASLFSTSADGRLVRVIEITSSSSFSGATRALRKLSRRSITRASATIEQTISG